jgi:hypothetical protein
VGFDKRAQALPHNLVVIGDQDAEIWHLQALLPVLMIF